MAAGVQSCRVRKVCREDHRVTALGKGPAVMLPAGDQNFSFAAALRFVVALPRGSKPFQRL